MKYRAVLAMLFLFSAAFSLWETKILSSTQKILSIPEISEDGDGFVAVVDTDRLKTTTWDWEIYYFAVDGPNAKRLTQDAVPEVHPKFSLNGYAFLKICGDPSLASCTAVVFASEEGNETTHKNFPGMVFDSNRLRLGVSGEVALVLGYVGSPSNTFRLGVVKGGEFKKMVRVDPKVYESSWHKRIVADLEGSYALIRSVRGLELFHVNATFGIERKILTYIQENSEEVVSLSLSPTGRYAAVFTYSRGNGRIGLFVGSPTEEIHKIQSPIDDEDIIGVEITKDGKGLFVSGYEGRDSVIYFVSLDSGAKEVVYRVENTASDQRDWIKLIPVASDANGGVVAFYFKDPASPVSLGKWIIAKKDGFAYKGFSVPLSGETPVNGKTAIEFSSIQTTGNTLIKIPIKLHNGEGIGSITLTLELPHYIEVKKVLKGPLMGNALFDYNIRGNLVHIGIVSTQGISGNGTLCYVEVFVENVSGPSQLHNVHSTSGNLGLGGIGGKPQVSIQEQSFLAAKRELKIKSGEVSDTEGKVMDVVFIPGAVILLSGEEAEVLRGDVDGNGIITSNDALLTLRMATGKLEPNEIADMDGNGRITAKDALEILKLATQNLVEEAKNQLAQGREIIPGRRWR